MSSERLVQFIGVVLFSPSSSRVPSLPCRRFSILLSALGCAARWFQRSVGERGEGGCPGGFCPSFVSSSNYDLPHEYEPYVNIRPLLLPSTASCVLLFLLFLSLVLFLTSLPASLSLSLASFFSSFSRYFSGSFFFISLQCPLPRRGHHFVLRGVANASAMTAAYSRND